MTEETRATRTVGDIVTELQREQKQFNIVIRILVGLLFVTAAVMVTLLVTSWNNFLSAQDRFDQEIQNAAAAARVSDAYAKYDLSAITSQLEAIRSEQDAQRDDVQLLQYLNRALAANGRGPDMSLTDLTRRAIEVARGHALGRRLNTTTAILVSSIVETPQAALSADEKAFLDAMYRDWKKSGDADAELKRIAASVASAELRGLAYAALAQNRFLARDAVDPGSDSKCNEVNDYVARAETLGLTALGPLAWSAECMRKQGRPEEAQRVFTKSLAYIGKPDATEDNRSLATRGSGTTLISLAAAGKRTDPTWGDQVVSALRQSLGDDSGLSAAVAETPMAAARELIKYATSVGPAARSSVLGVYTMENVGFTYVIENEWRNGFNHAVQLDATVSSPWNLIVLYICAEKLLADSKLDEATRNDAQERLKAARETLTRFSYDWFNEKELRTLLPEDYKDVVSDLISAPKKRHDAAQLVKANSEF